MTPSTRILIIYNPTSSSGKSKTRAVRLAKQLERRGYTNTHLIKSEYAGHAEEIAYTATRKYKTPVLISVSGDGGYNEIINGALRARNEQPEVSHPVCAIRAAGNANDHRRAVAKRSLLKAILEGKPEAVDILMLQFGKTSRYAHSYIGIGPSAETVADLNREKLTRWKEIRIVTRNLVTWQHFTIKDNTNDWHDLESLVLANIHRMSKVIRISDKTNLHDGLFNVIAVRKRSRLKFFYLLVKLVIVGGKNPPQLSTYTFQLLRPQLGHLDGEVIALPARTDITVSIKGESLLTLR